MYTKKVMEHFQNPKNMGRIDDYDGLGKVGNPTCGDLMWIYIKVKEVPEKDGVKEILDDIKVETFGCAAAIASSSAMTEMMIGKTLEEAMKLTRDQISNYLDGLPPAKIHCSTLSADGLRLAIEDYRNRKAGIMKAISPESLMEGGDTEDYIRRVKEIIANIKDRYNNKKISKEEFDELMEKWEKILNDYK